MNDQAKTKVQLLKEISVLDKKIKKLKRTETAFRQTGELTSLLAAIVQSSKDAIIGKSLDGIITSWNKGAEEIYGYTESEVVGKSISILIPPDIQDEVPEILRKIGLGERIESYETVRRRKGGQDIHVSLTISPIHDAKGIIVAASTIARDITEQKKLQQKIEKMATHDYLTGLPNRVLLHDRFIIAAALAERNKTKLAVMSLDLDNFKSINDTLGHDAGDQMLKAVSKRLKEITRASDTLARVGGDEFTLVMLVTNLKEDATTIARKILDSFIEPILIDGHQLHLSTSIGIAIYPEDAGDLENLAKQSDAAMYYSKGHGRNQFKFFGDGDVQIGVDHKSIN